jgi:endo-1,3(4)-beta-glucanase
MERHPTGLRASKLLPLMVLAQAQLSYALPLTPRTNAETGDLEAGSRMHFGPKNVIPHLDLDMDTVPWVSTSCVDEFTPHWTKLPVVQIPDGQIQAPTDQSEHFTVPSGDWDLASSAAPTGEVLTATEWNTVSTTTVTSWQDIKQKAPTTSGEALTSTVYNIATTSTVTNLDSISSAEPQAAAITTSQSTLPEVLENDQSTSAIEVAANSSVQMALEVTVQKTYTRSSDSTSTVAALQDVSTEALPLFADASSSTAVEAQAQASDGPQTTNSASSSSTALAALSSTQASGETQTTNASSSTSVEAQAQASGDSQTTDASSSTTAEAQAQTSGETQTINGASSTALAELSSTRTSPIMYGSITLTYTTHYDTTSGFPATAETVTPRQASSSPSTVDFYNPFPPSTTQEDVTPVTPTTSSSDVENTAVGDSDTRPSPIFYSEPTSGSPDQGTSSATMLQNTASATISSVGTLTSVPDSSLSQLSTFAVQTAPESSSSMMNNQGMSTLTSTSLNMDGRSSAAPFPTNLAIISSSIALSLNDTVVMTAVASSAVKSSLSVSDIFQAIATDAPPEQLSRRSDHPAPRKGIQPQEKKLQTNKFYSNFFLEDQALPSYIFPYSVVWANGTGATGSYGMAVSHTERVQFAGGETDPVTGAWRFYASPIGVHSVVLSATELTNTTQLTTDSLEAFSVNVNLSPGSGNSSSRITYPLVQGMGLVTAQYTNSTPMIASGIGFDEIKYIGAAGDNTTHKYRMELTNGFSWLAYVTPEDSEYDVDSFNLLDGTNFQGPSGFHGTVQVAKIPNDATDAVDVYDSAAGAYPTSGSISGSVDGTTGKYTLSWNKGGVQTQELLMFALPHHMQSLSEETKGSVTDVKLMTTVKGTGVAIRGESWTLEEPLNIDMEFAPYQPGYGSIRNVSSEDAALINEAGASELQQDMSEMSNLDSMYYSGKELAKYASIVFAVNDMGKNVSLAQGGLERLKVAMARFVDNKQKFPLVYEDAWGGAASSASYSTGDSGQDFGNSFYNDHHFHYGYHVYAAAVIAYLDPTWLETGTNKAWVNTLVRDYANSITDDPYFPFSRNFDFYHGHSWAKGLFASADGKDQESSSEDTMASYAIKMWGSVIGDKAMEARGNLMLAIQTRSLDNYYLYRDSNEVQPSEYIGNRAAGILFENKIDHVTYFGNKIEYIQGINMIPMMPFSTVTRRRDFVQTEWDQFFAKNISAIESGWRGILMSNLALIDPEASYQFFSGKSGDYKDNMLDGGASRTWYLAYAAGLKEAEAAGYEASTPSNSTAVYGRSLRNRIPRPTKRWVDGELVDCEDASQEDMESGALRMVGELDDQEKPPQMTAQQNADGKVIVPVKVIKSKRTADGEKTARTTVQQSANGKTFVPVHSPISKRTANGKRYVNGQLVDCDESNQDDMEAGILQMYNGDLDKTEEQQEESAPAAQPEILSQSMRPTRRSRIGVSGSPRLRQRARG